MELGCLMIGSSSPLNPVVSNIGVLAGESVRLSLWIEVEVMLVVLGVMSEGGKVLSTSDVVEVLSPLLTTAAETALETAPECKAPKRLDIRLS